MAKTKTSRTASAPADAKLSPADRAVLEAEFGRLEPVHPELAERLLRYVAEGEDAKALEILKNLGKAACDALDIVEYGFQRKALRKDDPPWFALLENPEGRDDGVLLRLAKFFATPTRQASGHGFTLARMTWLSDLDAPEWLEPLVVRLSLEHAQFGPIQHLKSRLSAELIERLLRVDGRDPDLIYRPAFPSKEYSPETVQLFLLSGLRGYGEGIARRPVLVDEALSRASAAERGIALEYFQKYGIPARPFLATLVPLAVCSAKAVREPAARLVRTEPDVALPHVLARLESGTPDERLNAARLIAGLEIPKAREALEARRASDSSPKVRAELEKILGTAEVADSSARPASIATEPVEIFRGVELAPSVLEGVSALVDSANRRITAGQTPPRPAYHPFKPIAPDCVPQALALLVQPTPWASVPAPLLDGLRDADASAFDDLLRQPELTPLHAARLLALSGILVLHPGEMMFAFFDFETPLRGYRESHIPALDLRTLGAAFQASAIDPLMIARMRVQPSVYRRFDWPPDAVWPYFAEHLDWLREKLATSRQRQFEWTIQSAAELRQEVLSILGLFPEPPAAILDDLWETALGASKTERPLAQRCLEKLPNCQEQVLAAIAKGQRQARISAAEWAARRRMPGAVEALQKALEAEKVDAVRSAFMNALEQLGVKDEPAAGSPRAASDPHSELAAEAKKGLKAGIPQGLDWFPFDACPELRWQDDDRPLDRSERDWLLVQAWKGKTPEPSVMLRRRVQLFPDDDAERLGQFVLDAWLQRDLRSPTGDEVKKRTAEWDQMFGGLANVPTAQELYQQVLSGREAFIHAPIGTAQADKGLLAVVAACSPPSAAATAHAYINKWYGNRVHQCRALVQTLAWLDRPEAVEALLTIAKRFRTKSIQKEAADQAKLLAARRGCTVAQLADRALPDLGLDAEGRLVLDYGPRRFFARLDDDAELVLDDESGARIKGLPDPKKADDPAKVEQAKAALGDLRKRVKALRKTIADRLYEAMCSQRSWRFADWNATLRSHPLAVRLCRRLVWSVDGGPTFRPLEDGSLTDTDDNEVQPKPDATIRLVHALTIPDDLADRWRRHLADYEIEPLFDQLRASAYRLPDGSRGETKLEVPAASPVRIEHLQRLARGRGYDPQAFRIEDGGHLLVKHFPGAGLRAVLDLESEQSGELVESISLSFVTDAEGADGRPQTDALRLDQVPTVLLSECVSDLSALAGTSSNP